MSPVRRIEFEVLGENPAPITVKKPNAVIDFFEKEVAPRKWYGLTAVLAFGAGFGVGCLICHRRF